MTKIAVLHPAATQRLGMIVAIFVIIVIYIYKSYGVDIYEAKVC